MAKTLLIIWGIGITMMNLSDANAASVATDFAEQAPKQGDKYDNRPQVKTSDIKNMPKILWRYLTETRIAPEPAAAVPVHPVQLDEATDTDWLYRLGHSSMLLQLAGQHWLIDPVFSERASPFSWAGPKRFHEVPKGIDTLAKIDGVIISHDHYDHLDQDTIVALSDRVTQFVVPLGVGEHLQKWGVPEDKIVQLDWWQRLELEGLSVTATPSQHFSGRGLTDGNQTLWASWVLKTPDLNLFYSGDSGYFPGFKTIGERYGPFDLTILENGAYDKQWPNVHMTPAETMQAHLDLQGKHLMPVHNGTFDLALHPWYEPFNEILALADSHNVPLITPEMGEPVNLNQPNNHNRWWKNL